ncbi:hypothetical protein [Maribacter halichondriae]|uniref:hypothetical protein n=1 Tax=Maribacter halichondriae TaxID=2980554 RepID=UPI002359CF91|nr:hypothetical protein [Maribacter sp. Hal144]
MKTLKTTLLMAFAFLLIPSLTYAQDSKTQSFWVHEDVVKPSMVTAYEKVCKDLTSNLKKHSIQGIGMIVTNTVDHRYLWVSPIASMADINYDAFNTLSEKMGSGAMSALFDEMDKSYNIEHDYVIHLDEELSYMPDGMTQTPEGQDYRKFHYFHYTPANEDMVREKAMAIKKLFESNGSNVHYRSYKSGFGARGAFYMVAIAAKDAVDYATKIAENNKLLGEEWAKTFGDFQASLLEYEIIEGQMRPDMAYSSSN